MFCQRCGNTLAPGARFCNSCGTPVTAAAAAAPISMARPPLVTVIAILHFVGGAFLLLGGVGLFLAASDAKANDRVIFTIMAVAFLIFGAASIAAGAGLWKMREWGRILQIVLAAIGLLGIPLGTIVSILLLVYFTRPHIKLLFSGKRLDQLQPDETAVLAAAGSSAAGSGAATAIVAVVVALGAVAFLGIFAAIAIPNFIAAKQRAMQKRTIADMRQAAQDVTIYRASHDSYPESIPPRKDAWGNNFRYAAAGNDYWIVSAAKDGAFEQDDVSRYTSGTTTNFERTSC